MPFLEFRFRRMIRVTGSSALTVFTERLKVFDVLLVSLILVENKYTFFFSPLPIIMKVLSGILLAWIHINLSNCLIEKRGVIAEDVFSNARFGAKFSVVDDIC